MQNRKNKTIVIGDIHGHYKELIYLMQTLLSKKVSFKKDTFVFLGDYIDGGPDVMKVLIQLIKWKEMYPHWEMLYGNHEDLMLDALSEKHPIYGDYYLWYNQGGKETTNSYVRESELTQYERALVNPNDVIPKEHINFLKNLPIWFENEHGFYVHGGIKPGMSIEENCRKTTPYDMIWIRDEFIESKYDWGKKIIFGHTINWKGSYPPYKHLSPIVMDNKIGLDTFAHNIGRLTAVILPDEVFVQTPFAEDASACA